MTNEHNMELNIATYNSTGLGVGQMDYISSILEPKRIDILLLQEIWLLQNYIKLKLNKIHSDYYSSGTSGMDSWKALRRCSCHVA